MWKPNQTRREPRHSGPPKITYTKVNRYTWWGTAEGEPKDWVIITNNSTPRETLYNVNAGGGSNTVESMRDAKRWAIATITDNLDAYYAVRYPGGKRRHGPWGALVKRAIAKQGKEAGELHRRAMTEDPLYEAQRRAVAAQALAENTGHLIGARRTKILRKLRQARSKLLVVSGGKQTIATADSGTVGTLVTELKGMLRK